MKFFGILFFIWGFGYVVAMFITVKGLPAGPAFLLFAVGILLTTQSKRRDIKKRENRRGGDTE